MLKERNASFEVDNRHSMHEGQDKLLDARLMDDKSKTIKTQRKSKPKGKILFVRYNVINLICDLAVQEKHKITRIVKWDLMRKPVGLSHSVDRKVNKEIDMAISPVIRSIYE